MAWSSSRTWAIFLCAVRALRRHKLRSGLSTLGVTIGIAAVVLVVAIGNAGSARTADQLKKLGDNLVWVEAGSRNINGARTGSHGTTSLTLGDLDAIRAEVPLIKSATPNVDGTIHLAYGRRSWTSHYRGVGAEYVDIKAWPVAEGAAFFKSDVDAAANVCLIGQTVRQQLFGDESPVGRLIRVERYVFQVVGLLAPKGQTGFGQDQDDTIVLPFTAAQSKIRGKGFTWLDDILCSAVTPQAVAPAIDQIVSLLRQRHGIIPGQEDDFNIRRPDEIIKVQIETARTFALLLVSVASISLLVGGIGIMNVMLASVTERTREIGVRLAVGATRRAVQFQFLAEGIILSLFGGGLGILLSLASAVAVERLLEWPITISAQGMLLATAFSIGVGVFFGFYPARRASALDPLAALRHE
ncbi:MAG TPA: ABC transporter permease [Polyangia bacterium]|nr:ABC transporter permease [Polyangia bacterium]